MDIELNILHGIDSQVVVTEKRVQSQQADKTKIAEHFVKRALRKQIVLELEEQVLLVFAKLRLVNSTSWIRDAQRECRMLENFQLLVDIRLGDERMQHV